MKVPRERAAEVLTMSSDFEEDPVTLEEVAAKAVEDVVAVESGPQKVLPLLQYLDRKQKKYADGRTNESYVEIVRNRTRAKVVVTAEVAGVSQQKQSTKHFRRDRLRKLRSEDIQSKSARVLEEEDEEEVERAKCASVDLLSRQEACRTAYDAKTLKVDELSAAAKKTEHEY
ncbi:hypothetical protein AXG93_1433s1140 [Marchantia polymorpha subsp. ruderalis]|uniref:Uncharacterized protein n=1 Tax=Marchantia polymorpha subsp. ruderalis TaxID=1480154 RepID=A0A176WBK9_MARPO|nr:hypothetical protein AXG93_1433s1140 [Marchantia polymorpha subsp. ruderalis]